MSEPQPPVKEGDVLASKYRVEKVLGAGGMGVVVAATQIEIDRRVALKFLLPGLADSDELIGRFMREAKASVRLKGKHIAQVLDVGKMDDGRPYIVMEHLDGRDLGDELKVAPNPLSIELASSWILQACEGLAEAHALGIVHRDIKPGNIFLTEGLDGRPCVKVLDFGISKTIDPMVKEGLSSLTKTEMLLGSPLYMAPEQMRSSKHVDERSDIWGLGAIFYELLTRRVPFVADTLLELCFKVAQETPPNVKELREDIPDDLAETVMRCLEKDPTKRWSNVGELATALEPFASPKDRGTAERAVAVIGKPTRARLSSFPDAIGMDPTLSATPPATRKPPGLSDSSGSGQTPKPEASTPENASAAWGTTHAEVPEKKSKRLLAIAGIGVVALAAILGIILGRGSSTKATPLPASSLATTAPPVTPSTSETAAMPSQTAAPTAVTTESQPTSSDSAKKAVVVGTARPTPKTSASTGAKPSTSASVAPPKPATSAPSDPGFIKVRE